MRLVKSFTDWILYTSFFAACCAVSLCIGTERLLLTRLPPLFTPLHGFVLGCTMMVYNAHFLIIKPTTATSDRYAWSQKHRIWHMLIFAAGAIHCSITIFFLSWQIMVACAVLGLLSFAYTLPLLPFGAKTRLRDVGWIKIFILTAVWTIVTSILPVLYWRYSILDYPFEILIRFVFMFVLCVAFDIRDMQTDLKADIHTLPNLIGVKNSYRLMDISILIFLSLSIIQYIRYPHPGRLVAEVSMALLTKAAIVYCKKHPSDKNYLGIVDGMMLLYGCLIAFFSYN